MNMLVMKWNGCPEIVRPIYLGIVSVDIASASMEHHSDSNLTPYITIYYLFFL